jgi:hypothetical protein
MSLQDSCAAAQMLGNQLPEVTRSYHMGCIMHVIRQFLLWASAG